MMLQFIQKFHSLNLCTCIYTDQKWNQTPGQKLKIYGLYYRFSF